MQPHRLDGFSGGLSSRMGPGQRDHGPRRPAVAGPRKLPDDIATYSGRQSEPGAVPNDVSMATGRLDNTNTGSVDSNLWFILGHLFHYRVSGNLAFQKRE
jgi:hypothetical protein